jgi:mannose-binding lectin 1
MPKSKIIKFFGDLNTNTHFGNIYSCKEKLKFLRAPNLAQRDGSVPFWIVTGDAIASNEQLRLAPSMRSRKGIAWNKRPFSESENFEIDFAFKVTGQRIGADGLALW